MTAPLELHYDTIYHIWNRGVNHATVFQEDENYRFFLERYAQHIEPVAVTYAYCLLPNHFHFLIRTRTEGDQYTYRQAHQVGLPRCLPPSQAFSNLFNGYVKAYNKRYGRTGGLYEDRFGRKPITSDGYLQKVVVYIHLNPVKHGFVKRPEGWLYTSYNALAQGRPSRLQWDEVMSWFGGFERFVLEHEAAVKQLDS